METLRDTTIDNELVVTSRLTLSGEIVVNSNIVVKENAHLIIRGAILYFDEDCGIFCEGFLEAISSTFDAKRLRWGLLEITGEQSSKSLFKNCSILNGSGLMLLGTSNIVVDSCTISGCKCPNNSDGGGIASWKGKNITIRNCTISECESEHDGGGIFMSHGTLVEKCIIQDCKAKKGGGISIFGGRIKDCKIERCSAMYGGGIASGEPFTASDSESKKFIESSTISKCNAKHDGGGIYTKKSGKIVLNDVDIIECTAVLKGSGIHLDPDSYLTSIAPSKIIRCKGDNSAYAVHTISTRTRRNENVKLDNFLFIDCIDKLTKSLIEVDDAEHGFTEINNCRAYNTLPNGDKEEYEIGKLSRGSFYLDGEYGTYYRNRHKHQ